MPLLWPISFIVPFSSLLSWSSHSFPLLSSPTSFSLPWSLPPSSSVDTEWLADPGAGEWEVLEGVPAAGALLCSHQGSINNKLFFVKVKLKTALEISFCSPLFILKQWLPNFVDDIPIRNTFYVAVCYTQEHKHLKQVSGIYPYLDIGFFDIFCFLLLFLLKCWLYNNKFISGPGSGLWPTGWKTLFYRISFIWWTEMFTT